MTRCALSMPTMKSSLGERAARGHMGRVLRLALHERKTDRRTFTQIMYYGMSAGWSEGMIFRARRFAQYAVQSAENTIKQFAAIEALRRKTG